MARLAIGNWKMHTTKEEAVALAASLVAGLAHVSEWDPDALLVGVAPPFCFLQAVGEVLEADPHVGRHLELVAQDCHPEAKGAFTSAVSAPMLRSLGVARVIVGHSERRQHFGDDDALVARKLRAVLDAGMQPVLCVGETLEERDAGQAQDVVRRQLEAALDGLAAEALDRVTVAYEPVWAIGTGRTATPEQAGEMHEFIQGSILAPRTRGRGALPVLYGGSVKPDNVEALASTPAIDGVLVGGASLDADSFVAIVRGCATEADARS